MPKLYQLPRFHSNLVYHRPSNISNIEALRNTYPNLYYEDDFKDEGKHEILRYSNNYLYKDSAHGKNINKTVNPTKITVKPQTTDVLTNSVSDNKRATEDFSKHIAHLQNYGSETRDFIISCLEKSVYDKVAPSILTRPPTRDNQVDVEPTKDDKTSCLLKPQNVTRNLINILPLNFETISKSTVSVSKQVPKIDSKTQAKSRLPLLIKKHKPKEISTTSSIDSENSKEKFSLNPSITKVKPNNLEKNRTPRLNERSSTKWFNENKLQFTKKMTSYVFTQYDINGDKIFLDDQNTSFGYSF